MELGEKIKRLRLQHGLTQEELALRCDLSKGFISQLERDLTSPSIATLKDVLECLGTDLRTFFSEPEEEKIVFGTQDVFDTRDEERGTVTRASRDPKLFAQPLPSPQELYAARGMDGLAAETLDYNKQLLALGINVNLAPVCDVSTDAGDFIYARSFGGDAAATSEFVTAAVGAIRDAGVAAVLKHFPGYGNNADTHTGVAIDKRPYETFEQSDFLPFRAGMEAGAPFVLVSHNVAECMDAALPASLSPAVHEVLRETLGFDGIVITDDLAMDAVKQYANGEAAVLAVLAGNDMLITSDYQSDIPAVLAAVADGRIAESDIDAHVLRILRYKQAQGWIK